jgi:hypothetical protein
MPNPVREAKETLKILASGQVVTQAPTKRLGIVSPCSTCKNFLTTVPDGDKVHVPCPRQLWIERLQQQDTDDPDDICPGYLGETGTEGSSLANPVYSESSGNVLIWVALEDNNDGVLDANGNILAPDLLSPGFDNVADSEYLRCEELPYVLDKTQAQMQNDGVLHEGDRIYAEGFYQSQPDMSGTTSYTGGTVVKATLPFSYSLNTPIADNLPSGC